MQKGTRPGTEKRCELLKYLTDNHTPPNTLKMILDKAPADMTDLEREAWANQALTELKEKGQH